MTDVAPILDHQALQRMIEDIDADGARITMDVFLAETDGAPGAASTAVLRQ